MPKVALGEALAGCIGRIRLKIMMVRSAWLQSKWIRIARLFASERQGSQHGRHPGVSCKVYGPARILLWLRSPRVIGEPRIRVASKGTLASRFLETLESGTMLEAAEVRGEVKRTHLNAKHLRMRVICLA